ncbi:MAG: hypothetical protein ABIN18_29725 [Pseudomonadota bacterium]
MEDFAYDISCAKDKFNTLKTDERFLGLLTLARFVNALRFCQKAGIDSQSTPGRAGERDRINSFFFISSILYEGFILVEKIEKYFKDIDSFKKGFSSLLKDRSVKSFRKLVRKRIRNKFVFHFDKDVAKESLENLELPEYIFASGIGKSSGEMVFVLAEEIAINYLLQPTQNESDKDLTLRFQEIIEDTADIMRRFDESTENLIAEALPKMGFTMKTRKLS